MQAIHKNRSGFSAIEIIASVAIVSMVAFLTSQTLLRSNQSLLHSGRKRRAANLARMVAQQYGMFAATNFAGLAGYDVPNGATPQVFFHAGDNLGYDGLIIVTSTTFTTPTSAVLNLTIQGGQGTNVQPYVQFTKVYTEALSSEGGQVVTVYVKLPCGAQTQADIISLCPGIAGITVSAQTPKGDNSSQGVTDSMGLATLAGVAATSANNFILMAPAYSSYTVPSNSPQYIPAYYAQDSQGNFVTVLTTTTAVYNGTANTIAFTNFQMAGVISGTVNNAASQTPMSQARVSLAAGAVVASSSGFHTCTGAAVGDCVVYSLANGSYSFGNVAIGSLNLRFDGIMGSSPTVQTNAQNYVQGYTDPNIVTITTATWPAATSTTAPHLTYSSSMVPMGTLTVHAKNADNSPSSNASVVLPGWNVAFNAFPGYYYPTETADTSGNAVFNNLFGYTSAGNFWITVTSTQNFTTTSYVSCTGNCVTVPQQATLVLPQGYTLQTVVVDDNSGGGVPVYPIITTSYKGNSGYYTQGTTDASGNLTLASFMPDTTDPTQPFTHIIYSGYARTTNNAPRPAIITSISGKATDSQTGLPVVNCPVGPGLGNGISLPIPLAYTDSDGNYSINNASFVYYQALAPSLICDNTTVSCYVCPALGVCTLASAKQANQMHINTAQSFFELATPSRIGFAATAANYNPVPTNLMGWYGSNNGGYNPVMAINGVPITGFDISVSLSQFPVQGVVTDSNGSPVANAVVKDANSSTTATTADGTNGTVAGQFLLWCSVEGRVNAGQPGTVGIQVVAQTIQNIPYKAASFSDLAVSASADSRVPIIQNVSLETSGMGGP